MITKVYTAKVTIDKGEYEDNRVYPEKTITLVDYDKAVEWLEKQKIYYETALEFIRTELRKINYWKYTNGCSYSISCETISEAFKSSYPDIDITNFQELNEIRFELFEIVIGEEYAANPENFFKPIYIGKQLYSDIPESLQPKYDRR